MRLRAFTTFGDESPHELPIGEVVHRIVVLTERLNQFWMNSAGWTPIEVQDILRNARLDRQVGLSRMLRLWIHRPLCEEKDASLILAWTNLGTLVEGTLKLYLTIYVNDYALSARPNRHGDIPLPDELTLEYLRQCLHREDLLSDWREWVGHVQQRRNAVHAFVDRDIGTLREFRGDVREYLRFLREVNLSVPYPDEVAPPSEIG